MPALLTQAGEQSGGADPATLCEMRIHSVVFPIPPVPGIRDPVVTSALTSSGHMHDICSPPQNQDVRDNIDRFSV